MLQHLKGYQRSITLIKTGRLNQKKTTQILIYKKKRKETGAETNINTCNSSASTNTSTYTINSKSGIHTSWFFITVGHKSTTILTYSERIGMQCYQKDYWVDDSITECSYISIFAVQIQCSHGLNKVCCVQFHLYEQSQQQ